VRLDGLTGLLNRRSGDEVLQQEWLRSQRSGSRRC
jgi:PleD family two-component response regulator